MTEASCEGCGCPLTLQDASVPALCAKCAQKAGLAYPFPSRRPLTPCARCQHDELIHVMPRERTTEGGRDYSSERAAPMALTYARGTEIRDLFDWTKIPSARPDLTQPQGVLEAWVCRRCGFVDWYAQSPEHIPIGALFGTRVVKVG